MSYEVVLLQNAQQEFNETIDWIATYSQAGVQSWMSAFEKVLLRLENDPFSFGLAIENASVEYEVRQATFRTVRGKYYRLLFTIVGNQVRVLHLRSPGQDAPRLS